MIRLPLSKSIALRVMTLNGVCASLGLGEATVPRYPDAGDVKGMWRALDIFKSMRPKVSDEEENSRHFVNIGEGGAPLRFFMALVASTPGVDVTLTGGATLRRRPLGRFIKVLGDAGADVRTLRSIGRLPVRITGRYLDPGELQMDPSESSQFVSALMMASILWKEGLDLRFTCQRPVSFPYIKMTAEIMRRFGAEVSVSTRGVRVRRGELTAPPEFPVEPDWSAASYFYEIVLVAGKEIRIERLVPGGRSLQGDSKCEEIFHTAGVETIYDDYGSALLKCREEYDAPSFIEIDMESTPDLVPAVAVGFALAGIRFKLTAIGHLRHKESDRLASISAEMRRIGYQLEAGEESLTWDGTRCAPEESPIIRTYGDHRIAMAFAPAAMRIPGLRIENPRVVDKSYPGYWRALDDLGFDTGAMF